MKDSYSFDIDAAGLDKSYDLHDQAYRAIFTRCGLSFVAVEADSGAMGGSQSQEFMVYTDAGEDLIASCAQCNYAANMEKATSRLAPVNDLAPTGDGKARTGSHPRQSRHRRRHRILQDRPVAGHQDRGLHGRSAHGQDKATLGTASSPFLRGDHFVNETKLTRA